MPIFSNTGMIIFLVVDSWHFINFRFLSNFHYKESIAKLIYVTEWLQRSRLEVPAKYSWFNSLTSGPWFNIKMSSYQYRKSHCGDKTILRPSYLHKGISYTGKMSSLYWIRARKWSSNFDDKNLGLYSLSGKTSYRQVSWSLETAIFGVIMIITLIHLTSNYAALLPRCLSNFRVNRDPVQR